MEANLRNVPTQARSRERLRRVLDAAEQVLAREGAAALTTTRVAQVAGIPVGSVYRYFPDKEAIAEALALRYWSDFELAVAAIADADEREPLADPAGAILEALGDGFRANPGFRALWYGGLRTERVRDATRGTRRGFTSSLTRILAVHYPGADPELRETVAAMTVLIGDGLIREAFRLSPEGEPTVLAEGRLLIDAYLEKRLGAGA